MRVVFAGTPPFAAEALEALADAGHEIPLVLTQPDRPAGRGLKLTPSAVALAAARRGLALHKPRTLKDAAAVQPLREACPDVMVVAAYGLLLPQAVLDIPARGCLNIHASLLPRWRGAAPVQRAILAGDAVTGITIMQMDAGLDTGPILSRAEVAIEPDDDAGKLTARLASAGARCIVEALRELRQRVPQPQDDAGATYAAKVTPAEAALDWTRSAVDLARHVRAFNPVPGAFTRLDGEIVKVWEVAPVDGRGEPGVVLRDAGGRLVVACGDRALELRSVQRAGGRRVAGSDFLRGTQPAAGTRFEAPAPTPART